MTTTCVAPDEDPWGNAYDVECFAQSGSGTRGNKAGGYSGILDLLPGDVLEWECEIINQHAETITFGENEAVTSEMCILIGDGVGPVLSGFSFF